MWSHWDGFLMMHVQQRGRQRTHLFVFVLALIFSRNSLSQCLVGLCWWFRLAPFRPEQPIYTMKHPAKLCWVHMEIGVKVGAHFVKLRFTLLQMALMRPSCWRQNLQSTLVQGGFFLKRLARHDFKNHVLFVCFCLPDSVRRHVLNYIVVETRWNAVASNKWYMYKCFIYEYIVNVSKWRFYL